jgi:ferredoxin
MPRGGVGDGDSSSGNRKKGTVMKVYVDGELCIGCEACVDVCPEVFEMQDDVAVVRIEDDVPEELEASVEEAAESCAVEAIIIED